MTGKEVSWPLVAVLFLAVIIETSPVWGLILVVALIMRIR